MVNKKSPELIAFENDPIDILTILGNNYQHLVRILEGYFPGKGKYVVQALVNGKADDLYSNFFVIKKRSKDGKKRLIFNPSGILKAIQEKLDRQLRLEFENHTNSHGFVTGRSTRTAAEEILKTEHINEKELTNIDVAGAFPAITGKVVRSLLRHKAKTAFSNWQINIIAKIACTSADRLATGAPSSPTIFNWRLTTFDHELEKAIESKGWKFIRYADDISIVHYRTQKKEAISTVIKLLKPLGLEIERKKLKSYHRNLKKIVGLNIQAGKISIPRKIRQTARALAFYLKDYGIKTQNAYTVPESLSNIGKLPFALRRTKGSLEAQLGGFFAYYIHALRPLIFGSGQLRN
jgi:hypothetical protein